MKFRPHPYALEVVAGTVPAGRLVRLACERHIRDCETGHERGLVLDVDRAERVLDFMRTCKHAKGKWRGKLFVPSPWQEFIVYELFGWIREDPEEPGEWIRRYKVFHLEISRKNGKSFFAALIALYMAFCDGEGSSEVYSAATTKKQSKLSHSMAVQVVRQSPFMRQRIEDKVNQLYDPVTDSTFEPLAAEDRNLDGLNVHFGLLDELHAHRSAGVYDVIDTATAARVQPMIGSTTTAGRDQSSVCWQVRSYGEKILNLSVEDDSFFAYIAAIDEEDDWRDEECWAKANPNLGVSVRMDDLRRKAKKAEHSEEARASFQRLHLNRWMQSGNAWLDTVLWAVCDRSFDLDALRGRRCFAGLDLSARTDLTALAFFFPPDDSFDIGIALPFFWIPEKKLAERIQTDKMPFDLWAKEGYIFTTAGNSVDQEEVAEFLRGKLSEFQVEEIAYDPWNAGKLAMELEDEGAPMIEFRQGAKSFSPPMKELEIMLLDESFTHGGHPVLKWQAGNVAAKTDTSENLQPDKKASTDRIDGMVALLMALGRSMDAGDETVPAPITFATTGKRRASIDIANNF